MQSADESGSESSSSQPISLHSPRSVRYHAARAQRPIRRHKRFTPATFSTETLTSLPEYRSDQPRPPIKRPISPSPASPTHSEPWNPASPPPTYPGLMDDPPNEADEDEERDVLAPVVIKPPRRRPLRRRRSIGTGDDKLDALLERSVAALEASTALLQSSYSTHSTLHAALSDPSFDTAVESQIQYLNRRAAYEDQQGQGLDQVLDDFAGLLTTRGDEERIARSLPAEDHMRQLRSKHEHAASTTSQSTASTGSTTSASQRRLRLSEGPRPRSPPPRPFTQYVSVESPNGEATASEASLLLPSTSGFRAAPHQVPLPPPILISPSPLRLDIPSSAPPTSTVFVIPPTPSGTAYTMLSHIQSRSATTSRPDSPELFKVTGRGRSASQGPEDASCQTYLRAPDAPFQNHPRRSQSVDIHAPSLTRHRVMESTSSAPGNLMETASTPNLPLSDDPASYAVVSSLRKILAESESQRSPLSNSGKQRAEGERPGVDTPLRRSSSAHPRPPSLTALINPTPTLPVLSKEDSSFANQNQNQLVPQPAENVAGPSTIDKPSPSPSLRRSALKGSNSSRSTPLSSGQSSPRVVSFSPLPPKHESDGSVGRAQALRKEKARMKASAKTEEPKEDPAEKRGWWSEWLLGAPPSAYSSEGRGRQFSGNRGLRDEGRFGGSFDTPWQM